MSPKIFDENGSEVYGTLIVNKTYAMQQGICGYARDLTSAQSNARVTNSPPTVKAIRAQGAGMSEFVISNEDAGKICPRNRTWPSRRSAALWLFWTDPEATESS